MIYHSNQLYKDPNNIYTNDNRIIYKPCLNHRPTFKNNIARNILSEKLQIETQI